jgi:hypothetical protein
MTPLPCEEDRLTFFLLVPTTGQITSTRATRALIPRDIKVINRDKEHHTLATNGLTIVQLSRDLMVLSRRHSRRRLTLHHQGREMTLQSGNTPLGEAGVTHTLIANGVTSTRPNRDLIVFSRRHSRRRLTLHHQGREMTLPGGDGLQVRTGMRDQLMVTKGATQLTGEATGMNQKTAWTTHPNLTLRDQLQH